MKDEKRILNMKTGAGIRSWSSSVGRLILISAALTIGACSFMSGLSTVDIGLVEIGGWNKSNASFGTLNSTKRWGEHLEAGQTLELDFAAQLDKGSLTLQVVSPQDAVIWELEVSEGQSKADSIEVIALDAGRYGIVVIGDGAGGSYQLKWQPR